MIGRGIAWDLDEHAVFRPVEELLVVGDGDPLLRRFIEILRVVVTILAGSETQFGGWRRSPLDGDLEVLIAVGLEPE